MPTPAVVSELVVAVRALCDFGARRGDLDLRFVPTPSAQEGIAGHLRIGARRGARYQREIALSGAIDGLMVRGRADGFDPDFDQLEEIKTHRGEVERIKTNQRALHWAQLKVYGALYCRQHARASLRLALVYLNLDTDTETTLVEECTGDALWDFARQLVAGYRDWAATEASHRKGRNARCQALQFPYPEFRAGQRQVAESVYRAAVTHRPVLINAPTGIGKSVATLFPLLKALPRESLDKIFFLTAKTSGRAAAHEALARMQLLTGAGAVRTLELSAREKICIHPEAACHGESCPLARGFYDRLPAARCAAQQEAAWEPTRVAALAAQHAICPYFLGQELSRWADVIIADYNYYFDHSAALFAQTVACEWRIGLLVDEAHNLVERGRDMYSARLAAAELKALAHELGGPVRRAVAKLQRAWRDAAATAAHAVLPALPKRFAQALDAVVRGLHEILSDGMTELAPATLERVFQILSFARLLESFGAHTALYFVAEPGPMPALVLQNCVPAPFLAARAKAAQVAVYFSATLAPFHYYRDLLGVAPEAVEIDVHSPFAQDQLSVYVAPHICTRYASRAQSIDPIVALLRRQFASTPANYLAFFSSYRYMESVYQKLQVIEPDWPLWCQAPAMSDAARGAFLERFRDESCGIGFAVLGGSFSEGVDLPGARLFGAFVVTLGLPQVNHANDILRDRLDSLFGDGFDYAYLYPGMRKVVQAAGRVIRSPSDQGVVFLIDARFKDKRVQALLPRWWPAPLEAGRDDGRSGVAATPASSPKIWQ